MIFANFQDFYDYIRIIHICHLGDENAAELFSLEATDSKTQSLIYSIKILTPVQLVIKI